MLEMIKRFPEQILEAIRIANESQIRTLNKPITEVYVAGMGGSGIGGDFVASFFRNHLKVPYIVNKGYDAPAYIDKDSLVIVSSYSGNTEETLSSLNQMMSTGARIICVASGGKILQVAKENDLDFIQVTSGWASPRACLGYSIVAQMFILKKLGLVTLDFETELQSSVQLLKDEIENIQEKAQHLAKALFNKTVVIYCSDRIEPVALRFRQQINENSKRLCWHNVIPEMNHNELVGWRKNDESLAVLFLRNQDDRKQNKLRMDLTKDVVSNFAGTTIDLISKGNTLIEKCLYLVHLLDYVSLYLADLNQVDVVEVKVIDAFKAQLELNK